MNTLNIPLFYKRSEDRKDIPKSSPFALLPDAMIYDAMRLTDAMIYDAMIYDAMIYDAMRLPDAMIYDAMRLTLSGSNYPYLELISVVPKMFELLRFDWVRANVLMLEPQLHPEERSWSIIVCAYGSTITKTRLNLTPLNPQFYIEKLGNFTRMYVICLNLLKKKT